MASFDQSLNILKTATDYPSVSAALQDLLEACPANQVESFKLKVATILREKQATEGKFAKNHPRALQEIDLKYKNLVNILSSYVPKSIVADKSNSVAKANNFGGLGSMVLKNLFQSKKKLLVGFGLGLGTICGLTYIYNKFKGGSSEPAKNPEDFKVKKLEGFEKTLAAMQRLRSLNKLGKAGSLEDFEGYLTGNSKKKKGEVKEIKKLVDWNKEEHSLMSSADRALKALANFKLDPPEIPLLSDNGSPLLEISSDDTKKKRKRREKKEDTESSEIVEDVGSEELVEAESTPENEPLPAEEPEEIGRLIPVVKRNKRIKKVF